MLAGARDSLPQDVGILQRSSARRESPPSMVEVAVQNSEPPPAAGIECPGRHARPGLAKSANLRVLQTCEEMIRFGSVQAALILTR